MRYVKYFTTIRGIICYMNKFHIRLKESRLEKGLRQRELAEFLNVDQRTISNWENDIREPNIDMIIKIAQYFEISTDYLLGNSD